MSSSWSKLALQLGGQVGKVALAFSLALSSLSGPASLTPPFTFTVGSPLFVGVRLIIRVIGNLSSPKEESFRSSVTDKTELMLLRSDSTPGDPFPCPC